ncbi:CAP domain-containing protein [Natrarchaeobaculum aegyptiacum]|uniref:Serine protease n=1 Tax=Natrarchaeobaculum aegyptiacum TaxID=745377 RepID=A0A2Z2HX76_9EURY|nr:CAP domain-containing protein [Natrarchaeobaculum aegyptiacum]ARS91870.1 serine protease [Natrarchaeobaculum aegyptiacum]
MDPPDTDAGDQPPDSSRDPGLLRGIVRLVFLAAVLALLVGGVAYGPELLEDRGVLEDVEINDLPSPSPDPPPAGERNPDVADPDDPGETTYETDVETVSSVAVEDFVHAEVNDRRADHGLEPLEWDGTVASVSRAHSHDMAERDYFAHENPEGEGPFDRFNDVEGYCRGYGENIALTWVERPVDGPGDGEATTHQTAAGLATGLVDQWMNSTEHRAAILEDHGGPAWDRGGVGVTITEEGAVYATHNFCTEW